MGDAPETPTAGDGTATPPADDPPFLKDKWHKHTSSAAHVFQANASGPYQKVTLFNFTFLGVSFEPMTYVKKESKDSAVVLEEFTRAGVCEELMLILKKAQGDIYRAYAAQALAAGATPSEDGFKAFCGVRVVCGWQFRGGQHKFGSAIDIDAGDNPYTVTRSGSTLGGEAPKVSTPPKPEDDPPPAKIAELRSRAAQAYERAWRLVMGTELPANQVAGFPSHGQNPGDAYDRFAAMHQALRVYFQLAHTEARQNAITNVALLRREFSGDPASFTSMVDKHAPFLLGLKDFPDRKALFEKIRSDYDIFQLVLVKGSLHNTRKPGIASLGLTPGPRDGFRDPSHGFLTIRKEIVMGIWSAAKPMRWGAVHFGHTENGDMMHFDRTLGAITKTTNDANESGFFYFKK